MSKAARRYSLLLVYESFHCPNTAHYLGLLSLGLFLRGADKKKGAMGWQVLGDRSLKLKYLNPNTLFVATGTQPGEATGAERHITAHIFDTVTGQLLFSQSHEVGCPVVKTRCLLASNRAITGLHRAKQSMKTLSF